MLFNSAKYKVFKSGTKSEKMQLFPEHDFDDYGCSITRQVEKWEPFSSDFYFLEEIYNQGQTLYSNFKLRYFPIAPSGKYNSRYGDIFQLTLRNMEYVGNFDGQNFTIDVPHLYTSCHELKILDVFKLEEDYNGISHNKAFQISKDQRLALEKYDDVGSFKCDSIIVTDIDTNKEYKMLSDIPVNKIGRIELLRVFNAK
jgi:hypothetical protein